MNFKKKELEEYIKEKQLKHLGYYLEENNVNDGSEKLILESSESFDDMIEEKNCLIEELKSCLEIMQLKYNEEVTKYSNELSEMKAKFSNLEEKIKILTNSRNNSEVVEFYENTIEKIYLDDKSSRLLNKLKQNLESILSAYNYNNKQNTNNPSNLKNFISNLIEKNEELNSELVKLKKCDRFAFVYKNLVDKAGTQMEKNKKKFQNFNVKYKEYIKNLEGENQAIKLRLQEEINRRREEESFSRIESRIIPEEIFEKKEIKAEVENKSDQLCPIKENISDREFFKTIASSKIIIFKRIYEVCDNLDKILSKAKVNLPDEDSKVFALMIKKTIGESLDLLGYIQKEIIYLHLHYETYYTSHLKLQKMINKIFSSFKV